MSELSRCRTQLGESAALWAGPDGVEIRDNAWLAISGVPSVEYNVALCHGSSGGEDIEQAIAKVADARVPAIVMAAGAALADAQVFVREGWICIGAAPLMAIDLCPAELDTQVRQLTLPELPSARGLAEEAFDLTPQLATVALPDACMQTEGQAVWGLFEGTELVACAAFVRVQEAVVAWSVATSPRSRRHGCAARLLRGVLAASASEGATRSLVFASAKGEPLYRTLGFRELERWQMWSRPRWVLARA